MTQANATSPRSPTRHRDNMLVTGLGLTARAVAAPDTYEREPILDNGDSA